MKVELQFRHNGILYKKVEEVGSEDEVRNLCCNLATGRFDYYEFDSMSTQIWNNYIVVGSEMLRRGAFSYQILRD